MRELVQAAVDYGFESFGISSHAPLPFDPSWSMKPDQVHAYNKTFALLKEEYADQIDLYKGLELDYVRGLNHVHSPVINQLKAEYLIGSVHVIGAFDDGEYCAIDGDLDKFKRGVAQFYGGDMKRATRDYFQLNMEMVDQGGIDIIGHMDKVVVVASKCGFQLQEESWYSAMLCELLELCRQQGTIVEINTKSREREGIFFPSHKHFKLLKESGVQLMVNTDCHRVEQMCVGMDEAYTLLLEVGIKECMYRKQNNWVSAPIINKKEYVSI